MLGPPLEAHPLPSGLERLLGGGLEVLPHDRKLAARVELDHIPREHADVDDVANPSRLDRVAARGLLTELQHLDLLRAHGESPAVPLDHVRDTDEAGDE